MIGCVEVSPRYLRTCAVSSKFRACGKGRSFSEVNVSGVEAKSSCRRLAGSSRRLPDCFQVYSLDVVSLKGGVSVTKLNLTDRRPYHIVYATEHSVAAIPVTQDPRIVFCFMSC